MTKLKTNRKDSKIEVILTDSGESWTKLIEESKIELMSNLELKGFRKGKVPLQIAEKHISKEKIWNNAALKMVESNYNEALDLLIKEKAITKPKVSISVVTDELVEAILYAESMPEITLGDSSKIKVTYEEPIVTDEELDQEIKQLNDLLKVAKEIKDNTINAKMNDIVNIDFLGKVEGKIFEGGEAKDFDLELGSKKFIPGFEEQIVGMKPGDKKDVKAKFPDVYPKEELAGKEAIFFVTLNSIKQMVDLEGEELKERIKNLGNFNSREEIITKIKEVALDRKKQLSNEKYFRDYVNEMLKLNDTKIEISDSIINDEIDVEFKRMEAQIKNQGMKFQDYLKMLNQSVEEFKEKNIKKNAELRIKEGLIYNKLVEIFSIVASDEEIENEYKKIANESNSKIDEVKQKINKNSIESNVIFLKLVSKLKEESQNKEN